MNINSFSTGPHDSGRAAVPPAAPPRPSRLWLWFVAAFAVQLAAWIAWFVVASHHQVQDVPLAPRKPVSHHPVAERHSAQTRRLFQGEQQS